MTVPLQMYQDLQEKYHALVTEVLAMKREGFTPSPAFAEPAALPQLPEVVAAAIRETADFDEDLTRTLTNVAWSLLKQGVDEHDVAQRIAAGEPVEL